MTGQTRQLARLHSNYSLTVDLAGTKGNIYIYIQFKDHPTSYLPYLLASLIITMPPKRIVIQPSSRRTGGSQQPPSYFRSVYQTLTSEENKTVVISLAMFTVCSSPSLSPYRFYPLKSYRRDHFMTRCADSSSPLIGRSCFLRE